MKSLLCQEFGDCHNCNLLSMLLSFFSSNLKACSPHQGFSQETQPDVRWTKNSSLADGKTILQLKPALNVSEVPMLIAEDIGNMIHRSVYFPTMDSRIAFSQVSLYSDDKILTVFAAAETALLRYRVVSMGYAVSRVILQGIVTAILRDYHFSGAMVHIL